MNKILTTICAVLTGAVLVLGANLILNTVEDSTHELPELGQDSNNDTNSDVNNESNNESNNEPGKDEETLKQESIIFSFGNNLVVTQGFKKTYHSSNSVVVIDGANVLYTTADGTYNTDSSKELLGAYDLIYSGSSVKEQYCIEELISILSNDQRIGTSFRLDGVTYVIEGVWENAIDVSSNNSTFTITNGTQPYKYNLVSLSEYAELEEYYYEGDFVVDTTYSYTITSNDVIEEKVYYDAKTKYYFHDTYLNDEVVDSSLFTYFGTYQKTDLNNGFSYDDSFVYSSTSTDSYVKLNDFDTYLKRMTNKELSYFIYDNSLFEYVSDNKKDFVISFTENFKTKYLTISNEDYESYEVVTQEEETQRVSSIVFNFSTTTKTQLSGISNFYSTLNMITTDGVNVVYADENGTYKSNYNLSYLYENEYIYSDDTLIDYSFINELQRLLKYDQRIGSIFTIDGKNYEISSVSSSRIELLVDGEIMTITKEAYDVSYSLVSTQRYELRDFYDGLIDIQIDYILHYQTKIDDLGHMDGTYSSSGTSYNWFTKYDTNDMVFSKYQQNWTFLQYLDYTNVTSMNNTFIECTYITALPEGMNLENVTSMSRTFYGTTRLEYVPELNTKNVTTMTYLFYNSKALNYLGGLETPKVTNMSYMFYTNTSLTNVPLFDTSSVTTINRMFYACTSLQAVPLWDLSSVVDMDYVFLNCYELVELPLWDLSSVKTMSHTFYQCTSIVEVPLWDTSSNESFYGTFDRCSSLEIVPLLDTSKSASMNGTFQYCTSLKYVPDFNTSKSISFAFMFNGCSALEYRPNLDLSYAISNGSTNALNNMYQGCYAI